MTTLTRVLASSVFVVSAVGHRSNHAFAGGDRPVVAVFDLENRAKLKSADATTLTEYITTRLAESGRYRVVPKGEVQSVLRAKKAESYQSCYDESCQIEIGRELAAEKTLSSKVSRLGATCIVTVQLYDLAQGASEGAGTAKGGCKVEDILGLLDQAIAPLTQASAPRAPSPSPPPMSPSPSPPPMSRSPSPPPMSPSPPPEVANLPMPNLSAAPDLDRPVRGLPATQNPRARTLLVTEIQGLERLFATTQRTAAVRPQLLLRLGLGYAELAAAARQEGAKNPNSNAIESASWKQAAKHLDALVREHPDFAKTDQAYYALALAYEQSRDLANARRCYYGLIEKFPSSSWVPYAYLSFAELSWRENKMELANQAWKEAAKHPSVSAYAHYRLAIVQVNMGEREAALAELVEAKSLAEKLPSNVPWRQPLLDGLTRLLSP